MRHRSTPIIFVTALLLSSVVIAAPTTSPAAYKPDPGPNAVTLIKEHLLKDAKRQRDISIRIRAPKPPAATQPAAAPLVIFSHGAGGSSEAFGNLCEHWASHGYIVVNPTHSDSVKLRREKGERFDPAEGDVAKQVVGGVNLLDRRADVQLILDSLDQIEQAIAKESGAPLPIDRERIALAGHSAGAMTTQALAGLRFFGPRGGQRGISFPENRIKAFVVISGQGLGRPTFTKDSWKDIRSPMLVIAGSQDFSPVSDEKPETRRHPYEYAPDGDKYLLFIDGATHGSYAGKDVTRVLGEKAPDNISYITDLTAFSTLAFLQTYLKSDPAAKAYLGSDGLTRYPGGKAEYQRK